MSKKFLVLGGGYFGFGGGVPIYFYGHGDFSDTHNTIFMRSFSVLEKGVGKRGVGHSLSFWVTFW